MYVSVVLCVLHVRRRRKSINIESAIINNVAQALDSVSQRKSVLVRDKDIHKHTSEWHNSERERERKRGWDGIRRPDKRETTDKIMCWRIYRAGLISGEKYGNNFKCNISSLCWQKPVKEESFAHEMRKKILVPMCWTFANDTRQDHEKSRHTTRTSVSRN